jgi:phosphoglycerate dehydrogenase-like enzyme
MKVLANDIKQISPEVVRQTGVTLVDRESLLKHSDFVSLNCDLNPTSLKLMNATAFALMKTGAIVVNTARGPIVEEAALVDALSSGRLGGAALDVFEHEPLPLDSPLRRMTNVLLAPHNSNSSPKAWAAVHQSTIKNLFGVLENMR